MFIVSIFVEISELIANSVDPDQTPRSAASDLGHHCLPLTLLLDARHKWVNVLPSLFIAIFSSTYMY